MHGPPRSPYQDLLGEAYDALAPAVRVAHEPPLSAEGAMDVEHGNQILTPFLIRVMKLPARGTSLPVTLRVTNEPGLATGVTTMAWRRQIGATVLATRQFARAGHLVEQSGPGTVAFLLRADADGSLQYESATCRFLHLRIPRSLSPRVRAQVSPDADGWRVEVAVEWRGRPVCRYGGVMRPVHQP
jgi:hypothetical protein